MQGLIKNKKISKKIRHIAGQIHTRWMGWMEEEGDNQAVRIGSSINITSSSSSSRSYNIDDSCGRSSNIMRLSVLEDVCSMGGACSSCIPRQARIAAILTAVVVVVVVVVVAVVVE